MTEGNFTDYVKVLVASGNGDKGSSHLHREKFVEKGGLTVVMEEEGVILFCVVMKTFGH